MNKELKELVWVRQYEYVNPKLKEKLDIIETALKSGETLCKKYRTTNKRLRAKNQKYKKALEIIKKKCPFFNLFSDEDNFCPKGHYRVYDNELYQFNELTKEEYELLKEMLDDE